MIERKRERERKGETQHVDEKQEIQSIQGISVSPREDN